MINTLETWETITSEEVADTEDIIVDGEAIDIAHILHSLVSVEN